MWHRYGIYAGKRAVLNTMVVLEITHERLLILRVPLATNFHTVCALPASTWCPGGPIESPEFRSDQYNARSCLGLLLPSLGVHDPKTSGSACQTGAIETREKFWEKPAPSFSFQTLLGVSRSRLRSSDPSPFPFLFHPSLFFKISSQPSTRQRP